MQLIAEYGKKISIVKAEMERQLAELKDENASKDYKLSHLKKFALPFTLSEDQLKIKKCSTLTGQMVILTKSIIIEAFEQNSCLWEVSTQVVKQLRETQGGNWICDIRPNDVEDGLNFHKNKYIRLSFEVNGLKYRVIIAQSKQTF